MTSGVLALRVWQAPLLSYASGLDGGMAGVPYVGDQTAIRALKTEFSYAELQSVQLASVLTVLYGLVALASLGFWVQHRGQRLFLWVSLFSFANITQFGWWHELMHLSYVQVGTLASFTYQPLEDIATWFVLLYLLGLHRDVGVRRWVRWAVVFELVLCFADGVSVANWSHGWPQITDLIVSELILIPELLPLVLLGVAVWQRKQLPLPNWLVAIFALTTDLVLEVGAFLSQGLRYTHWNFWTYLLRPLFTAGGVTISLGQISATLLLFSIIAAVYRQGLRENRREAALHQELHSAQELQRVLIPEELPSVPGYELSSAYRPALEVGGDFFQLLPQRDGSALLVVGDVSGKGIAAAMAVSLIVGTMRTLAEQMLSPAELLVALNERLTGKLQGGFVTCIVVLLQNQGSFATASAGHPGPVVNGKELALPGALPLGMSFDFDVEERSGLLQPGDQMVLYSDGLLEARNRGGELLGFERVQRMLATCVTAREIAEDAVAFGQEDDVTVVAVTRLRIGAPATTTIAFPGVADRVASPLLL